MKDWTKMDKEFGSLIPYLREDIKRKRAGRCVNFFKYLENFVKGHTVLDIGVVDHDIGSVKSERWKHGLISKWSNSAIGIDILSEEVNMLRKMGFNVYVADATSDIDLGLRVERIFIGDVIEHVDNPVNLLKFASRHLAKNGLILITTPNPMYISNLWESFFRGTTVNNPEHTCWISPIMALELSRRSGLNLKEYWLLQSLYSGNYINKLLKRSFSFFLRDSELISYAFMFIFEKSSLA
jgi:hypothetical protein